ncbi:hypothetical protein ACWELJ_03340 [Nocardia sp. NPDC004582]
MPKHLITVAAIAMVAAAMTGCGDHRSSPLTPPAPTSSVPVLGGGRLPDVIDVPTAVPSTTSRTTTTTTKAG